MLSEIKSIKYYHAHLISSLRGQKQRLPPCSDSMNENNCGEHCIVNGIKSNDLPPFDVLHVNIIGNHCSLWDKKQRLTPKDIT